MTDLSDLDRDPVLERVRLASFRNKLVSTARKGGSMVPVMVFDVIRNEIEHGPSEDTARTALEGFKGMLKMAEVDITYRFRLDAWMSGETSTVALRGLYSDANNAPYFKSLEIGNAVDTIDTGKLHVRQAREELAQRAPVEQLAVDMGANIFRIVGEENDRYAFGFCAANEINMMVDELKQYLQIEADALAARDAEPYREMQP
jgi:hypothetical protein